MVFAPTPLLTVTVEKTSEGDEIHLHAGGQGFWVARMLSELGLEVCLCGPVGGETGRLLETLVADEGVRFRTIAANAGNGSYVHDRRDGQRKALATMPPAVLTRHELDELYTTAFAEALNANVSVLSGPADPRALPADTYRRLATDLRALGSPVVADLAGEALEAAIHGGLTLLKVSHEELIAAGRVPTNTTAALIHAMEVLVNEGAQTVVVSRADQPALALVDHIAIEIKGPVLEHVDHRGAGDSMTAGIAAGLARGLGVLAALRLGFAAGAINVTRHGLATGQRDAIETLATRVEIRPMETQRS
jgi:1-phosphofructokinase